jgi:hypothetical protein
MRFPIFSFSPVIRLATAASFLYLSIFRPPLTQWAYKQCSLIVKTRCRILIAEYREQFIFTAATTIAVSAAATVLPPAAAASATAAAAADFLGNRPNETYLSASPSFQVFLSMCAFRPNSSVCTRSYRLLPYICGTRDSVVGIATGYGLDGRVVGVRVAVGSRIFSSRPALESPNLLSNGYRGLFPRG